MRPSARVAALAAGALVTAVLATGCSSSDDTPDAAHPASGKAADKPAKTPDVTVGESGTYTAVDSATGTEKKMSVTFKDLRAVTPSEIHATKQPKGQYVVLTLTVKNVGSKDGGFHPQGVLKWSDGQAAEQDVSTRQKSGTGDNLDATYRPGQSVTGDVVLDIPGAGGKVNLYDGSKSPAVTFELPAD
ncbi:DUF4352 domain-containing protein [Streptomyces sp. NPDC050161]|uniref:DUF4352 domain-containing protein n=1 Tax=Streptomyces sp. NPDC050161 TaxID=3365604 RepID=UPI003798C7FB